eukprot:389785-Pyramimonas_sp.AAC.1
MARACTTATEHIMTDVHHSALVHLTVGAHRGARAHRSCCFNASHLHQNASAHHKACAHLQGTGGAKVQKIARGPTVAISSCELLVDLSFSGSKSARTC